MNSDNTNEEDSLSGLTDPISLQAEVRYQFQLIMMLNNVKDCLVVMIYYSYLLD